MSTKKFHLGAVLSMTTGKLLCHIDDVYCIAQHLAGEPIWTHQLPRVAQESRTHLLEQFPALDCLTGDDVTSDNWELWLAKRIAEHGEWLDVASLPEHAIESINPISELVEKAPPDKIFLVTA